MPGGADTRGVGVTRPPDCAGGDMDILNRFLDRFPAAVQTVKELIVCGCEIVIGSN